MFKTNKIFLPEMMKISNDKIFRGLENLFKSLEEAKFRQFRNKYTQTLNLKKFNLS